MHKIIDGKIGIEAAQKCGSRTLIGYVMLLQNPNAANEMPVEFSSRGDYTNNVDFERKIEMNRNHARRDKYPVIGCIVRSPLERFLSAYGDKMKKYYGKEKTSVQEFMDMYEDIPSGEPHHSTLNYENKFDVYFDIKFHIAPLVKRYGENSSFYNHIFNLSEMNKVRNLIEDYSGKKLPDLSLNETYKAEKPILTKSQQAWIYDTFREDVEVYGKWM